MKRAQISSDSDSDYGMYYNAMYVIEISKV